jgi:hypothetical protein
MVVSGSDVRPLLPGASRAEAEAILGAMQTIAAIGGPLSDMDRRALAGTDRFIFGHPGPPLADSLREVEPEALAAALAGTALAEDAIRFLTVMAFVDGALDKAKIAAVLRYAEALGVHGRYLDEIAEAARDRLQEVLADMTRANMESITGRAWPGGDVNRWLMPYAGDGADPALAARFAALGALPPESFGHALWAHFRENGYAFPGEPAGLNVAFSLPHDSVHVLTGYDTSPRGEILASTFTAAMHRSWPMAGHVLPVILSWHVGVQINEVARDARNALDPEAFWRAWAAGAAATVDTFAPEWDFWTHAATPLAALRERWSIPAPTTF